MAAGLNQKDLADRIGKTRPLISYIEQTGIVNENTLNEICKVLRLSVEDLKEIVNEPRKKYKKAVDSEAMQELEKLRTEMEHLRDLLASQKKVIAILEDRIKRKKS